MTLPVDLKSQDFFRDPAATVRNLQAAGPVVEVRFPMIGRVWMTTTQEMAARVLKDGKLFTMRKDEGAIAARRWWHGRPLLPRLSVRAARRQMCAREPVHTVAEPGACGRARRDPLAQPSWRQGGHQPADDSDAERPLD
jgi:cytochrome P450 PksS